MRDCSDRKRQACLPKSDVLPAQRPRDAAGTAKRGFLGTRFGHDFSRVPATKPADVSLGAAQYTSGLTQIDPNPAWSVAELKAMLDSCDGGLAIWDAAKAANGGNEPVIKAGTTGSVDMDSGEITLDASKGMCKALQQLIQELSNLSRIADLRQIFQDAEDGKLSREQFIRQIEEIEYDSGVRNVLQAFDACQSAWPCATTPAEAARNVTGFEDYYRRVLPKKHPAAYGEFWDDNYRAEYRRKHPRRRRR